MYSDHTSKKCKKLEDAEFSCQPRSLPLLLDVKAQLQTLGSKSSMDCMQLRSPLRSYHYQHVSEQTKSLQELQNEVGALLEFRDLVIETFPDLKTKMGCSPASSTVNGLPSLSLISRREWEPGIRVRRKIGRKDSTLDSSSTVLRSRSNSNSSKQQNQQIKEPKSGEGSGSVIQDSGFSTETNSSKETHSASSNSGASQGAAHRFMDDELWNLLDVIHRKSNRLREEIENSRSTNDCDKRVEKYDTGLNQLNQSFKNSLSQSNPEEIQVLRKERNRLLDKLSEMEAETISCKIKESKMEEEYKIILATRNKLEEKLNVATKQKMDLSIKLNDLGIHLRKGCGDFCNPEVKKKIKKYFAPVVLSHGQTDGNMLNKTDVTTNLGYLDGILSSPTRITRLKNIDSNKVAFILLETNVIELQRHLLTITVQNQVLQEKINKVHKTKTLLKEQFEKSKEDIEDLKFQLEEKSIELEGARAQLRVIESKSEYGSPEQTPTRNMINLPPVTSIIKTDSQNSLYRDVNQISTPSMKAMIPLLMDDVPILHHSSSTESAQDHAEVQSNSPTSKQRLPSKIPLPGQKTNVVIKPPTGKNSSFVKNSSGPPSNRSLSKSTSSLQVVPLQIQLSQISSNTKIVTPSFNKCDSSQGWRSKDISLERQKNNNGSSIPISSNNRISVKPISSPILGKTKRDCLTSNSRVKTLDSLCRQMPHSSLSHSNNLIETSTSTTTMNSNIKAKKDLSVNATINNSSLRSGGGSVIGITGRPQPVVPLRRISNSSVHRYSQTSNSIKLSKSNTSTSSSNSSVPQDAGTASEVNKVRGGLRANFWNWLKI